jgi:hypothetical protein
VTEATRTIAKSREIAKTRSLQRTADRYGGAAPACGPFALLIIALIARICSGVGAKADIPDRQVGANSCLSELLFDHLVGEREQLVGNFKAERLCGFEVDDQLEFGRLQNRKVGWLFSLKDAIDIRS